jgi:hypothetical protein
MAANRVVPTRAATLPGIVFPCLRPHTRATFASGGVEMATQLTDEERLKEVVKSALVEVLEERKDLVREVIEEALEDAALARAIEEGDRTAIVNREEILRTLDGNH